MLNKSRMGTSSPLPAGTPDHGLPLSSRGAPPVPLTLLRADRTFPGGPAQLVCTPA